MPRPPSIGMIEIIVFDWIGDHRHHVKCNYCHRIMIGGITRFKKHMASKKGEIKGYEVVPKEVREIIAHHLATRKPRKPNKRRRKIDEGMFGVLTSTNYSVESDSEHSARLIMGMAGSIPRIFNGTLSNSYVRSSPTTRIHQGSAHNSAVKPGDVITLSL